MLLRIWERAAGSAIEGGCGECRIEGDSARVIALGIGDVTQGGVGAGAVVEALGAIRSKRDADPKRAQSVVVAAEAEGADALMKVRPEVLRLEGQRLLECLSACARSPVASRKRPAAACSQAVRGLRRVAQWPAASARLERPSAFACACRAR